VFVMYSNGVCLWKNKYAFDGDTLTQDQIPLASGYTVILAPIKIEEQSAGGIILASDDVKIQESTRFISKVIAMGPLAYMGDKFKPHPKAPAIPFCKIGDIVAHGQYTGSTLPCKVNGEVFNLRFMNDDEIKMVITDPSILNI